MTIQQRSRGNIKGRAEHRRKDPLVFACTNCRTEIRAENKRDAEKEHINRKQGCAGTIIFLREAS